MGKTIIPLSVAPMLDLTDRHERFLLRLISKRVLLYSEMISTGAILHNKPEKFLEYNKEEHPLALQLGGSSPKDLAECAKIAEDFGYDEINLNCGCPSERVQNGAFGACLMNSPALVAECVSEMQNAVKIPVSVKTRIGIDNNDSFEFFLNFVETVASAGCKYFIVHARKAWLKGLSPKENRSVPPLKYETVFELKKLHPDWSIVINGGVKDLNEAKELLKNVDGVMIGRAAYETPLVLSNADSEIFGEKSKIKSLKEVLNEFIPYAEEQFAKGVPPSIIVRHLMGLSAGLSGARKYRQTLSEPCKPENGIKNIKKAVSHLKIV